MKRILALLTLIACLFAFSSCNSTPLPPETGFTIRQYYWDGGGVSSKEISTCDLAYNILNLLSSLEETGDVIPKISDDIIDTYSSNLPIERGTIWLECGSVGLFRIDPEITTICKVKTHLGKGKVLEFPDELRKLLIQAINYHPYNSWFGIYENGSISLEHKYEADSVIKDVKLESIYISNKADEQSNIILKIKGAETKIVTAKILCAYSSDNLFGGGEQEIKLKKGFYTTFNYSFKGSNKWSYSISIDIEDARINLLIRPDKSE